MSSISANKKFLKAELLQLNQTQILSLGNFVNEKKREKLPTKKLYQYQHFFEFEFAFIQFIEGKIYLRSMSSYMTLIFCRLLPCIGSSISSNLVNSSDLTLYCGKLLFIKDLIITLI